MSEEETASVLTSEEVFSARFPLTKFREGYDQDAVDDYLDEVVRVIAYYEALADQPEAEINLEYVTVRGIDVRHIDFELTHLRDGYDQDSVDDYLDLIAATLEAYEDAYGIEPSEVAYLPADADPGSPQAVAAQPVEPVEPTQPAQTPGLIKLSGLAGTAVPLNLGQEGQNLASDPQPQPEVTDQYLDAEGQYVDADGQYVQTDAANPYLPEGVVPGELFLAEDGYEYYYDENGYLYTAEGEYIEVTDEDYTQDDPAYDQAYATDPAGTDAGYSDYAPEAHYPPETPYVEQADTPIEGQYADLDNFEQVDAASASSQMPTDEMGGMEPGAALPSWQPLEAPPPTAPQALPNIGLETQAIDLGEYQVGEEFDLVDQADTDFDLPVASPEPGSLEPVPTQMPAPAAPGVAQMAAQTPAPMTPQVAPNVGVTIPPLPTPGLGMPAVAPPGIPIAAPAPQVAPPVPTAPAVSATPALAPPIAGGQLTDAQVAGVSEPTPPAPVSAQVPAAPNIALPAPTPGEAVASTSAPQLAEATTLPTPPEQPVSPSPYASADPAAAASRPTLLGETEPGSKTTSDDGRFVPRFLDGYRSSLDAFTSAYGSEVEGITTPPTSTEPPARKPTGARTQAGASRRPISTAYLLTVTTSRPLGADDAVFVRLPDGRKIPVTGASSDFTGVHLTIPPLD